jgi:DNA polymerase-4
MAGKRKEGRDYHMPKRVIMHVDMDAFFAAIEEKRHQEYRGKPLVVGGAGDPTRRGVVSTANYEARKYGVQSGMPLRTALEKCPDCIFLPVDFETYVDVSERFHSIIRAFSPLVESWGLDEAFLDVSKDEKAPEGIGQEIKRRIRDELGLTCSIGIAPNKLLAKMASGLDKPDGLTVLRRKDVEKVLGPLPVSRLLWVGPKTTARLAEIGVGTIADLRAVPLEKLQETFGPSWGESLYYTARGVDESPLTTSWEPKSMSHEVTFETDTSDIDVVRSTLARFARYLSRELKESRYVARTVTVKVRLKPFSTHTHQRTLEASIASSKEILAEALSLLEETELDRPVRLVGLRVSNLEKTRE